MIPARYRGRVDIGVNGAYWAGSLIGTPGLAAVPECDRAAAGLAAVLPGRPGAGGDHHLHPRPCRKARAGCSPTAAPARPGRPSPGSRSSSSTTRGV